MEHQQKENMNTNQETPKRRHWALNLIFPLVIFAFSTAILYGGYFGPEENNLSTTNQIIWWIIFVYSVIRIISIIVKRNRI